MILRPTLRLVLMIAVLPAACAEDVGSASDGFDGSDAGQAVEQEDSADTSPVDGGFASPQIVGVTASDDDGNVPANTIDGRSDTRWSAEGLDVWIQFELATATLVESIDIAWYRGDERQASFDIQLGTSTSSSAFVTVGGFTSSGGTLELERYTFPAAITRFVRILGRGNSDPSSDWNSITMVRINGPSDADAGVGIAADAGITPDGGALIVDAGTSGEVTTYDVADEDELATAVATAQGGDTIRVTASIDEATLRNLSYPADTPLRIVASGPTIRFQRFELRSCSGVSIEGFLFASPEENTLLKIENSTHVGIIGNVFDNGAMTTEGQSSIVTTQASADIEIAYNEFMNIRYPGNNSGSFIKTQFDEPQLTQRLHIHHNYFHDIEPVASGDGFDGDSDREAIVFGVSDTQDIATHHIVEHNRFEDCDGENEIITIKTSNNIVRYNTFVNSLGSVSIRFGSGTDVYGNFFFADESNENAYPNDTGGIRVYGRDHRIYNNYLQGLSGSGFRAPIIVDGGDTVDSSGGDGHERPSNVQVVNNTLIDCDFGIAVGANYPLAPEDTVFANNIFHNLGSSMFAVVRETRSTYARNIGFGSPPGRSFTTDELWVTDPMMMDAGEVHRLMAMSPAINYGVSYIYVNDDMDGQTRVDIDVGADEVSSTPVVRGPMAPSAVGPSAVP